MSHTGRYHAAAAAGLVRPMGVEAEVRGVDQPHAADPVAARRARFTTDQSPFHLEPNGMSA
jgi:hypothetical protein